MSSLLTLNNVFKLERYWYEIYRKTTAVFLGNSVNETLQKLSPPISFAAFWEKLFSRTSEWQLLTLFLPFLSAASHTQAMLGHDLLWSAVLRYTMLQRYQNCLALHKTDLKRKIIAVGLWHGSIWYGINNRITTVYNLKDLQMPLCHQCMFKVDSKENKTT